MITDVSQVEHPGIAPKVIHTDGSSRRPDAIVMELGTLRFTWRRYPVVSVLTAEGGDLPMPFHQVCQDFRKASAMAMETAAAFKAGVPPKTGMYRRLGKLSKADQLSLFGGGPTKVKQHRRRSKKGTVSTVHEYTQKREKKEQRTTEQMINQIRAEGAASRWNLDRPSSSAKGRENLRRAIAHREGTAGKLTNDEKRAKRRSTLKDRGPRVGRGQTALELPKSGALAEALAEVEPTADALRQAVYQATLKAIEKMAWPVSEDSPSGYRLAKEYRDEIAHHVDRMDDLRRRLYEMDGTQAFFQQTDGLHSLARGMSGPLEEIRDRYVSSQIAQRPRAGFNRPRIGHTPFTREEALAIAEKAHEIQTDALFKNASRIGRAIYEPMKKGGARFAIVTRLSLAEQLAMFGAAPGSTNVKQHRRRSKGGQVTVVGEHQRKTKGRKPKARKPRKKGRAVSKKQPSLFDAAAPAEKTTRPAPPKLHTISVGEQARRDKAGPPKARVKARRSTAGQASMFAPKPAPKIEQVRGSGPAEPIEDAGPDRTPGARVTRRAYVSAPAGAMITQGHGSMWRKESEGWRRYNRRQDREKGDWWTPGPVYRPREFWSDYVKLAGEWADPAEHPISSKFRVGEKVERRHLFDAPVGAQIVDDNAHHLLYGKTEDGWQVYGFTPHAEGNHYRPIGKPQPRGKFWAQINRGDADLYWTNPDDTQIGLPTGGASEVARAFGQHAGSWDYDELKGKVIDRFGEDAAVFQNDGLRILHRQAVAAQVRQGANMVPARVAASYPKIYNAWHDAMMDRYRDVFRDWKHHGAVLDWHGPDDYGKLEAALMGTEEYAADRDEAQRWLAQADESPVGTSASDIAKAAGLTRVSERGGAMDPQHQQDQSYLRELRDILHHYNGAYGSVGAEARAAGKAMERAHGIFELLSMPKKFRHYLEDPEDYIRENTHSDMWEHGYRPHNRASSDHVVSQAMPQIVKAINERRKGWKGTEEARPLEWKG